MCGFVDIHCHLVPGLDDGAKSWGESLQMARLAVDDGIVAAIVTPHQLGAFAANHANQIRNQTQRLRQRLREQGIGLDLAAGADVRIEPDLVDHLCGGRVLSLADHGVHVLLELPHELYFPLEPLLKRLAVRGFVGILSHPERNRGILGDPRVVSRLVDAGCLMQLTAGSLLGSFGPSSQRLAESLLVDGLVHFIASDAHGARLRRPLLRKAFERVAELTDVHTAREVCCHYPRQVYQGREVPGGRRPGRRSSRWFRFARSA